MIVSTNGVPVKAVVATLPEKCTRRSNIQVEYFDETYTLPILQASCEKGIYVVEDTVNVSYYKPYDMLSWPGEMMEKSGKKKKNEPEVLARKGTDSSIILLSLLITGQTGNAGSEKNLPLFSVR